MPKATVRQACLLIGVAGIAACDSAPTSQTPSETTIGGAQSVALSTTLEPSGVSSSALESWAATQHSSQRTTTDVYTGCDTTAVLLVAHESDSDGDARAAVLFDDGHLVEAPEINASRGIRLFGVGTAVGLVGRTRESGWRLILSEDRATWRSPDPDPTPNAACQDEPLQPPASNVMTADLVNQLSAGELVAGTIAH